jgi:branched-chain amino acid transport system substrate-binding protein
MNMTRWTRRSLAAAGGALCVSLALAACSSSKSGTSSSGSVAAGSSSSSSASASSGSSASLTASDVGVTPTTITIGVIGTKSGQLGGFYGPSQDAIQAWADMTNAAGGIDGRKIVVKAEDDQGNSQTYASDARDLANQVFAFVGSISQGDGGGAAVINQDSIPDLGFAETKTRQDEPTYAHDGTPLASIGYPSVATYAKSLGATKIGYLTVNAAEAIAQIDAEEKAFTAAGIQTCYKGFVPVTQTDYTSYVLALKAAGCNAFHFSLATPQSAGFQKAVYDQQFHPVFGEYVDTVYSSNFVTLAGGAAVVENAYFYLTDTPVEETSVPGIQQMVSAMKQYFPNDDPHSFQVESNWADAVTFGTALKAAGPNPTRKGLLNALGQLKGFTAGGLVPPANPRDVTSNFNSCVILMKWHNGAPVRVTPASGFAC